MGIATVNISFQKDLLKQIDLVAKAETRSRSELIREAARMYIERKKRWQSIFSYGEDLAADRGIREADVLKELKRLRRKR
ncbi:MAG: ribbon-helix-helix domain-containing protein [Acidobacteriota bacterium]|nr:ribbon-helix-helix domain-containing protein [Acidobacteriota bacterium]